MAHEGRSEATSSTHPEGWLRLAQVAGGVGLFDWTLAARAARCSPYLLDVIGRPSRGDAALTVAEALGWVVDEDRARVTAEISGALAGEGAMVTTELRVRGEDERERWIALRGEIHRDARGRAERVLGAVQDITARKRVELDLQEVHARLSLALRAGRAGLWDWEISRGPDAFVSPEFRHLYGLTSDEPFSYGRWLERVAPADRARVEAYGREVLARGSDYSLEFRIVHPWRGERWVGSVGWVTRGADGRPVRFSGVHLDITSLKRAEQAERELEERFRKVFENVATGIVIAGLDGRYEQCNPAYAALLGYAEAELRGRDLAELIHPEDRAASLAALRGLGAGEVPSFEIENRMVRKDGSPVWVRTFVSVLTDEAGQPAHVVALVTDITERRAAQAALQEAGRRKDEFLATLAHELRNPLAPLRTGFEVLRASADRTTRERAREMMERQLGHMVRLIDDLLDVSRISRGLVALERAPLSLQVAVQDAVEAVAPQASAGGLALRVDVPPTPVWVEGDLTRLVQVVGNVISNAVKFTPAGGQITVSLVSEGDAAVIRVRDTGIGIAPDMLPRMFELFAQASSGGGQGNAGLGIGLFLVRRLVELHGGTVEATSPGPGPGAQMTIRLPRRAAPPLAAAAPPPSPAPRAPGRRILVVDDNTDAAELLSTLLALQGHEVRVAHDGPEALAAARAFGPEVVFLDLGLPGMSGLDVGRTLRAEPAGAGVVLVALTGWGGAEDRQRTTEAGFDHHLTKPVGLAAILEVLGAGRGGGRAASPGAAAAASP